MKSAREALEQKGFSNVHRPEDSIGDYIAERAGQEYRIEVKRVISMSKIALRKGFKVKKGRLKRQQARMLKKGPSLYLVYFRKTKRWILKDGTCSKVRINDRSLF